MAGKWVRERVLMLVDQAWMDSVVSASLGFLRDTAASLWCEAHLAQGRCVCDSALTALGASPGLEPQKLSPEEAEADVAGVVSGACCLHSSGPTLM